MAKHMPTVHWSLRRSDEYPRIYVMTTKPGTRGKGPGVKVSVHFAEGVDGVGIQLTRNEARLLARRIQQCLEASS